MDYGWRISVSGRFRRKNNVYVITRREEYLMFCAKFLELQFTCTSYISENKLYGSKIFLRKIADIVEPVSDRIRL